MLLGSLSSLIKSKNRFFNVSRDKKSRCFYISTILYSFCIFSFVCNMFLNALSCFPILEKLHWIIWRYPAHIFVDQARLWILILPVCLKQGSQNTWKIFENHFHLVLLYCCTYFINLCDKIQNTDTFMHCKLKFNVNSIFLHEQKALFYF